MRLSFAVVAAIGCCCVPALAQTAGVTVAHDDADGIIAPGETVRVTATLAWNGAVFFGRLAGDLLVSGDAGSASNLTTEFPSSQFTQIGTPHGGSVIGFAAEIPVAPIFTPLVLPIYTQSTGIRAIQYDWTAPLATGTYTFAFVPAPAQPNMLVYLGPGSQFPTVAPTTYLGTSITVVPAPGVLATVGSLGLSLIRRRRRRQRAERAVIALCGAP